MSNGDRNGRTLTEGDRVRCDESESGVVCGFGGLGVFVKMNWDGRVIDWANDQVEYETPKA